MSKAKEYKLKVEETKKPSSKTGDLYGLDLDLLETLGLGDMITSKEEEKSPVKKDNDLSNMTFEDMRRQFDIDHMNSHVGRLRGACKDFKDV